MMTERKWTPGPWFAVRNSSYWEIEPAREYGDDHIPYSVGDVCASDPGDTKGCQEPNAHLIAAAPDLYEALEYMLACHRDMHDKECEKARGMSLEALAKARGES